MLKTSVSTTKHDSDRDNFNHDPCDLRILSYFSCFLQNLVNAIHRNIRNTYKLYNIIFSAKYLVSDWISGI